MRLNTIVLISFFATAILTSVFCGLYEKNSKKEKPSSSIIKLGILKIISSIGISLTTTLLFASVLSYLIKPQPQDVMPAFMYDGTYIETNTLASANLPVEQIIQESTARLEYAKEEANFDFANIYFRTGKYDLSVDCLERCFAINPSWKYAYDLGVVYGYMGNYLNANKYLNRALEYDPPLNDRSVIISTMEMINNYFYYWLKKIFN